MAGFSSNPRTEWLATAAGDDRDMRMLEDFSFTDDSGKVWWARKDAVINGASIPTALWSSVGSPYTGDYRRASIVHDIACDDPNVTRKAADRMFYEACRSGGCSEFKARTLYAGVRIGAWANHSLLESTVTLERVAVRETADIPTPEEQFLQSKLAQIQADLAQLPPGASVEQLDAVIANHLPV